MYKKLELNKQIVWLAPIILLLGVMPLIMHEDYISLSKSAEIYFSNPYDLYTAVKSKFIIFLGVLSLFFLYLSNFINKKRLSEFKKDYTFFALAVYIILALLSSIFSAFPDIAFFGVPNHYEGFLIIFCYFIFWFTVYIQLENENQIKWLIYSVYFFISISFIIGVSQFIGKDILISDFLRRFILSKASLENTSGYVASVQLNRIYLTLFNQNYVGSFMSMAFIICFCLFIFAKDMKMKVLHGVFSVFCFFMVIGSTSRVGFFAIFGATIFACVILFRRITKNWKSTAILFLTLIITLFAMDGYLNHAIIDRLKPISKNEPTATEMPTVNENTAEAQLEENQQLIQLEGFDEPMPYQKEINSFSSGSKHFSVLENKFTYKEESLGGEFIIEYVDGKLRFFDENGKNFETSNVEGNAFSVRKHNLQPFEVYENLPIVVLKFTQNGEMINVRLKHGKFKFPVYGEELLTIKNVDSLVIPKTINDFNFEDKKATIYADKVFNIEVDGQTVKFTDDKGEEIDFVSQYNEKTFFMSSQGYEGFVVFWDTKNLVISAYNPVKFAYENDKLHLLTDTGKKLSSSKPEIFPAFKGRESMFSSRGYIWGLSAPLLKETIFLGKGPDTFMFYFPQYDYAGKIQNFGTPLILVDKPHSNYLQIALNTGILSLIAFLGAIAIYFYNAFKIGRKIGLDNDLVKYNVCFICAMVAYLIAALINDSVVFVTPLFWVLLAMGCAVNRELNKLT